jgi:hypothetical protein
MRARDITLTSARLKTPRAAGIAGIVFSILIVLIFWLFRSAVPADPLEKGAWLASDSRNAAIALNLIPFAGVAFLWFIGVVRDRLGGLEDRFFATVFLGSALLFLAMLFCSAAILGGLILVAASAASNELVNSTTFQFARAVAYVVMNVYAIKMASVFMISTSTVIVCTRIVPRWIAVVGFMLAIFLLLGSYCVGWSIVVFPAWVLLISAYVLMDNLRGPREDPRVR